MASITVVGSAIAAAIGSVIAGVVALTAALIKAKSEAKKISKNLGLSVRQSLNLVLDEWDQKINDTLRSWRYDIFKWSASVADTIARALYGGLWGGYVKWRNEIAAQNPQGDQGDYSNYYQGESGVGDMGLYRHVGTDLSKTSTTPNLSYGTLPQTLLQDSAKIQAQNLLLKQRAQIVKDLGASLAETYKISNDLGTEPVFRGGFTERARDRDAARRSYYKSKMTGPFPETDEQRQAREEKEAEDAQNREEDARLREEQARLIEDALVRARAAFQGLDGLLISARDAALQFTSGLADGFAQAIVLGESFKDILRGL